MHRAVLAAALLLVGCRAAPRTPDEHSTRAVVIRVPLAASAGAGTGGVSCVALLLRHHGADLDLEAASRFPEESAASATPTELRDYLRGRGFAAELLRGELGAAPPRGLLGWLAQGTPAILALEDRFVLAYGFDPAARTLLVDDPLTGRRELSFEALEQAWRPTGRLLLVAVPWPPVRGGS